MAPLPQRFRESWRRNPGTAGLRRILVAVSGGSDSVVLLHLLCSLRAVPDLDFDLDLAVAHFNHGLRGPESDQDQTWVADLAQRLGLPCLSATADLRARPTDSRESMEMKARRLRHAFLAESARTWKADAIALAHHADDQAELFLIRLLRGAGGAGLGGMRWRSPSPADPRVPLLRPLLEFSKAELEQCARSNGWLHREDASNQDSTILRNRIRHELLPLLEENYQPGIRDVLRRTGELVSDEAAFVEEAAGQWLKSKRRRPFARLHPALQRAILRLELWKCGHAGGFELIEKLRERTSLVSTGPEEAFCRDDSGRLRRVKASKQTTAAEPSASSVVAIHLSGKSGKVPLSGGVLEWRLLDGKRPSHRRRRGEEWFDFLAVGRHLRIRHRRSGDRFRALGMSVAARVQNLLINRKIPAALRDRLWLAESENGGLFWIEGFAPGEEYKVSSIPGRRQSRVLAWRFLRDSTGRKEQPQMDADEHG